eukprot:ANDGO_05478.mRNA.1 mitochondrial CRAL-TRIO domain-containing protein C589.09
MTSDSHVALPRTEKEDILGSLEDADKAKLADFKKMCMERRAQREEKARGVWEKKRADVEKHGKKKEDEENKQGGLVAPEFAYHEDEFTDLDYCRFMVARKFDVDHAYAMFEKAAIWFWEFRPDLITEEEAQEVFGHQTAVILPSGKEDKCGRPVIVVRIRFHDKSKHSSLKTGRAFLWIMHECFRRALAQNICSFNQIFDMGSLGRKNFDPALEKFMVDVLQNYYPERLGACLILHSGWFFWLCWKVVKPWLDKRTASKIVFIDSKHMKEQLLQYFSEETLPSDLLFPEEQKHEEVHEAEHEHHQQAEEEKEASAAESRE